LSMLFFDLIGLHTNRDRRRFMFCSSLLIRRSQS
jgi:hypothetical protein